MKFRNLRADELEARVATVTSKGCSVLIYKDARVDMNVLDETVGPAGWQRDHKELNGVIYCGIGIETYNYWVWKWDAGSESQTEAEKGAASDSFKRAGFNWGIGRALYTAPFIWFNAGQVNLEERNGRWTTKDRFKVEAIEYEADSISYLRVANTKTGAIFTYGRSADGAVGAEAKLDKIQAQVVRQKLKDREINEEEFISQYGVDTVEEMTQADYADVFLKFK